MTRPAMLLAALATLLAPATAAVAQDEGYAQPAVEAQEQLSAEEASEAEAILARFAEDYRQDPMAISGSFVVRLADRSWWVDVDRVETSSQRGRLTDHAFGPHEITLSGGEPDDPTFVYTLASMDVLRLIDTGQVNAGTAAMQSFGSDQVGVETGAMEGFAMDSGTEAELYHHLTHFFTRGIPEITHFGVGNSLETHGAQMTALHFMKGFRVGYFTMQPEQTVNSDPRLQSGQMPNLFIITRGRGVGHLGEQTIDLEPGMSVYVAPFVRHEFTAVGDEPMEGILVLFGDNSDFAFGTSYPSYLEDLYEFHGSYPFRPSE